MTETELASLLAVGIGQHTEFVGEPVSARELAASLIAFANADGGTIVVGVDRRGEPIGLRAQERAYDLALRALRGGAYDFIHKPIDRDDFVASLDCALRAHALHRRVRDRQLALERCARELEGIVEKLDGREP